MNSPETAVDIARLLEELARPSAFPHPADPVVVHQTHISIVFLAGSFAYKIKKPLDLGFLDFTTLERRRHFCAEEVRLNRRLAPEVYLDVVPVVEQEGHLQLEGSGPPLEWAVKMRRLPEDATLLARVRAGTLDGPTCVRVARRLAAFHAAAEAGPRVAEGGRWTVVARNARENFSQTDSHVGTSVTRAVHHRVRELTETRLQDLRGLIEDRARRGVPRDTHGDLHLDHVYLFPEREPPGDLAIVDCIEFNTRFRYADPVADAAFLTMDLTYRGRPGLARAFATAYLEAADDEGAPLMEFYAAYRAAVRAKVEGFEVFEAEVSEAERDRALASARAHWLLCLGMLEAPERRPALLLVGGLPGSGKSTLADGLARRAGFQVVSSDRVRKELAAAEGAPGASGYGQGIYTTEWTHRTYARCLERAREGLLEGRRVLVDASFRDETQRRRLLALADDLAVPARLLMCRVGDGEAKARLDARRGGPSDADWNARRRMAQEWHPIGGGTAERMWTVESGGPPDAVVRRALGLLAGSGLH